MTNIVDDTEKPSLGGSAFNDGLGKCPCGAKPDELVITDAGQGGKWATVHGSCCAVWEIEFCTGYEDLTSDKCLNFAKEAWNNAPRG